MAIAFRLTPPRMLLHWLGHVKCRFIFATISHASLDGLLDGAAATPNSLRRPRMHVPALDGIRGLAILMVMVFHLVRIPKEPNYQPWAALFGLGTYGVDLFFVLSGFLITGILVEAKERPHFFRNFYARRTLRIFPLYFGYLIAYYFLVVRLKIVRFGGQRTAQATIDLPWLWFYATNILIAIRGNFITASLNHFWTLAVEEHFYLIWPLTVYLLSRANLIRACCILIPLAFAIRCLMIYRGCTGYSIDVLTPCRVDAFAVGGLFSILRNLPAAPIMRQARLWVWPTLLSAFICVWVGPVQSFGYTLLALGFGFLIVSALGLSATSQASLLLCSRPMVSLGKYSYALYVFHHPINIALERLDRVSTDSLMARFHSLPLAISVHASIAFLLSFMAAYASWHLYEKHFLQLKRFFPN